MSEVHSSNEVYRKPHCPFGEKAVDLLHKKGIVFEDHVFASEEEEDALKNKLNVDTTPQIYLDGELIGGYTDLAQHLDASKNKTH